MTTRHAFAMAFSPTRPESRRYTKGESTPTPAVNA